MADYSALGHTDQPRHHPDNPPPPGGGSNTSNAPLPPPPEPGDEGEPGELQRARARAPQPAEHRCPECGIAVGGSSGRSPAKHAIYCLNVSPADLTRGPRTFGAAAQNGDLRAQRIMQLLEWEQEGDRA